MPSKPSKERATIRDVAKLAEVSPITVSRVVNKQSYVSPETRERVERAIEQLNYIPNTLSQSLRYQKTDMVTLLISDVTNPFWTTITRGVEDVCRHHGLNVILCNTDEDSHKLESYVHTLLKRQVDGFIVATTNEDQAIIHMIEDSRIPVVLIDRTLTGVRAPAVYSNNEDGAYDLMRHLLELGHQRIAMISGSLSHSTSLQRISGYRKAMRSYGLDPDQDQIIVGNYTQKSGYDSVKAIFKPDLPAYPSAILAGNNFIAYGALIALDELGIKVPEQLSLVAFDDSQSQIFPKPFLTTAAQKSYQLGREAATLLIKQMQGTGKLAFSDIVLPIDIIIRASTAPPKK